MKAQKWFSVMVSVVLVLSMIIPVALAEDEDTIKIGGLAPLTGPYAVYGWAVRNGADLYVSLLNEAGGINGKKVELMWDDHAASDQQAQKMYLDYVEDGCVAILGDVLTSNCRVIASLSMDDGIPVVTSSGTAFDITEGKENVFRTCFIDEFQGVVMANFAKQQGYNNVAILYGTDSAYSMGLLKAFKEQADKNELNIVAEEGAAFTDIDFKAQLTNIKNAAPDAVFLPWYGSEAALILNQANELGLKTIFMGADGISDIVDKIDDKSLLTSMTYSDHFAFDSKEEKVQKFIQEFTEKYGEEPTISFSATAYDAALVICQAIAEAELEDYSDLETVYEVLCEKIHNISAEGVSGTISFDENNNPIKSAIVMTFDAEGGKHFVTKVDPQ